jgi:hypothetical protein
MLWSLCSCRMGECCCGRPDDCVSSISLGETRETFPSEPRANCATATSGGKVAQYSKGLKTVLTLTMAPGGGA